MARGYRQLSRFLPFLVMARRNAFFMHHPGQRFPLCKLSADGAGFCLACSGTSMGFSMKGAGVTSIVTSIVELFPVATACL